MEKYDYGCKFCNFKGWYWKQPEKNLNLLPSGNFERLGNEIKSECLWCKLGGFIDIFKMDVEKIDKSEWKTKNPKLFEYDSINHAVDIFIRKDPDCPFPFHKEDWYHQGFYFNEFIVYLNNFFERYKLPFTIKEKNKKSLK